MTKWEYKVVVALVWLLQGAMALLVCAVVASFTVLPMMANYRECGTIFLCANQH